MTATKQEWFSALCDVDRQQERLHRGVSCWRWGDRRVGGDLPIFDSRIRGTGDHTSTTIVTFLMVFLIQHAQKVRSLAYSSS